MSFKDPFAGLDNEPKKPKKGKPEFDRAIKGVSRRDAIMATGQGKSTHHGQYYQLTTRLPLELVDEIREWAATLQMTQQDLQRYCFYRGLEALKQGERPAVEEVVVRKRFVPPTGS